MVKLRKGAVAHVRRRAKKKGRELTIDEAKKIAERKTNIDKISGGRWQKFDYAGDGTGRDDKTTKGKKSVYKKRRDNKTAQMDKPKPPRKDETKEDRQRDRESFKKKVDAAKKVDYTPPADGPRTAPMKIGTPIAPNKVKIPRRPAAKSDTKGNDLKGDRRPGPPVHPVTIPKGRDHRNPDKRTPFDRAAYYKKLVGKRVGATAVPQKSADSSGKKLTMKGRGMIDYSNPQRFEKDDKFVPKAKAQALAQKSPKKGRAKRTMRRVKASGRKR